MSSPTGEIGEIVEIVEIVEKRSPQKVQHLPNRTVEGSLYSRGAGMSRLTKLNHYLGKPHTQPQQKTPRHPHASLIIDITLESIYRTAKHTHTPRALWSSLRHPTVFATANDSPSSFQMKAQQVLDHTAKTVAEN